MDKSMAICIHIKKINLILSNKLEVFPFIRHPAVHIQSTNGQNILAISKVIKLASSIILGLEYYNIVMI